MIIIGIDPGSRLTGYGIIKLENNIRTYITSGVINTKDKDIPDRLTGIYNAIQQLIIEYNPDVLAIEETFMGLNANSTIKLSMARAVAILACNNVKIPTFEYSARQVKKSVAGKGSATKEQVANMIKYILNLNDIPQFDAADALAIALMHANNNNMRINLHRKYNQESSDGVKSNRDLQILLKQQKSRVKGKRISLVKMNPKLSNKINVL